MTPTATMRQILEILTNNLDCPNGAILLLPERQYLALEDEMGSYKRMMDYRPTWKRHDGLPVTIIPVQARSVEIHGPRGKLVVRSSGGSNV